jgi:hypothetical protein
MSSRGPHGGEPGIGQKRPASSSNALQIDPYCGRLAINRTRLRGVSRALETCWKDKYLLLGIVALVIYGVMRLRLQIPFAFLFATSSARQVVGQCPSYTEYSKVYAMNSWRRSGIDVIFPEPAWNAVRGPARSPIYAARPRLQDLHKFRGGSKSAIRSVPRVAKLFARM